MRSKLVEMLHLDVEPVGIYFGNTDAECDAVTEEGKRNCIAPLLLAAARGKIVGVTEEGCGCPGGTVGCCFGDGFTKKNPNIHKMLSQGMGDDTPPQAPIHMREGERFFCDAETALKWRNAMPFSERGLPRVVFAPESRWEELGTPGSVLGESGTPGNLQGEAGAPGSVLGEVDAPESGQEAFDTLKSERSQDGAIKNDLVQDGSPRSLQGEAGAPDLVLVFADPDRLSALVTMLGFHNGRAINTIVPYGAACHSIVFAAEQLDSDDPMAVMGLFDISQRNKAFAGYLSLTMPFALWEDMQLDLDKSCLTTHAWKEIEKRL